MRWSFTNGTGLFAALVLLGSSVSLSAGTIDRAAIDEVMTKALEAWQVPGAAVVIVQDDQVVYLKGIGVKKLGSKQAVTPDTVFPLASCTKAFTTAAMAILVDEGKMSWDDPVRQHLDYFRLSDPLADGQVTLRDLVTHRTGLGGHDLLWYRSSLAEEELIRRMAHVKPSHPFRGAFQYQSMMFMAAGQSVARAAQSRWEEFIDQRLVKPLGMKGVSFTTGAMEKAPDHASPHRKSGNGKVEAVSPYRFDAVNSAGSMHATARDLGQWIRFQLGDGTFGDKRLVSEKNLTETHMPQTIIRLEGLARVMNPHTTQLSYGMAWVIQDYRGHLLVSHAGAIDGFRAHITLVPEARLGIGLLHNLQGTNMNLAVSNRILDLYFAEPEKDWNAYLIRIAEYGEAAVKARAREFRERRHPGTAPAQELKAYAGTYEDRAYGTSRIVLDKGKLVWEWSGFRSPLEHYHYDTFDLLHPLLSDSQLSFTLNPGGEVASLRVLNVEFKRKQ